MTDDDDKKAASGRDTKQERLASALRENLKRRKAQARERKNPSGASRDGTSGQREGDSVNSDRSGR